MHKHYLFLLLTILFSFLIFFLENFFVGSLKQEINLEIENTFVNKLNYKKGYIASGIKNNIGVLESAKEKGKTNLERSYILDFDYFPDNFKIESLIYSNDLKTLVSSRELVDLLYGLKVELHKKKIDVRGRMENGKVKLFGVKKMSRTEFLSVGVHELAHYIDIYFLREKVFIDLSEYFYNISWESTQILKAGNKQADFVSGYAMTNKYEDFAESFTYYMIHNKDFLIKTKKSELLKSKYDFFTKFLFKDDRILDSNFKKDIKIKDYYWDITKIDFSLNSFLIFLKK